MTTDGSQQPGLEPTTSRDLILASIGYIDLELSIGKLRIHPYISARAMDAYFERANDPKAAFQSMCDVSREDQSTALVVLPEEDAEVVARLYADAAEFRAAYDDNRQAKNVFDAFSAALSSTEMWRSYKRSLDRLEAQLHLYARVIPTTLTSVPHDISRMLADAQRIAIPLSLRSDLQGWITTRAIAAQLTSASLLSRSLTVENFSRVAKTHFDTIAAYAQDLTVLPYFRELTERAATVNEIVSSHASAFASLNAVAASLRNLHPSESELGMVAEAFRQSTDFVKATNEYFGKPIVTARSVLERATIPALTLAQIDTSEQYIEDAADQSDDVLHGAAEQTIVIGNAILESLKEVVGAELDVRLSPHAAILERMSLLAKPQSFLQQLQEFALNFQRAHWKDLWMEQGKKFKTKPEGIARMGLSMYLSGTCLGTAFVGKELGNGDGYVDILVNFLGLNYVLEVKIVGATWSIGDAKKGLDQLDAYIQNYGTSDGYLIVFDGRTSTKGEKLPATYTLTSGATVHVVTVKCYFDRPSS